MIRASALLSIAMLCPCGCTRKTDSHPSSGTRIYYGKLEESGFVEAMNRPENADIKADLLARASAFTDVNSAYFFDPAHIQESLEKRQSKGGPGRILSGLAETLGPAAALTGDQSLLQHGAAVLRAIAATHSRSGELMKNENALERGEMAHGLAMACLFFSASLSPGDRALVEQVLREYVESLLGEAEAPAWYTPYSNWTAVTIGGAGLGALALENAFPAESPLWVARAKKLLRDYFDGSYVDGAYVEHGYIEYAMVNLTTLMAALANRGDRELIDHPNLKAMANWRVFNSLPGGTALDPRGTTGYAVPGQTGAFASQWPLLLSREHHNPRIRWLWERSNRTGQDFPFNQWKHSETRGLSVQRVIFAEGAPESKAPDDEWQGRFYFGGGLAIWRNGFQKNGFFFSISAGTPRPTTHDQGDAGHFNLYSDGVAWATDPGPGGRAPGDRAQGVSHSVVQIDGRSQALTGGGSTSGGKALGFEDHPGHGWIGMDLTDPYQFALSRKENSLETKHFGEEIAAGSKRILRQAIVVNHRGPGEEPRHYVVIFDDLTQDDSPHKFVWQMITEKEHHPVISGNRVRLSSQGAWLDLHGFCLSGEGAWNVSPVAYADGKSPGGFQKISFATDAVNPKFLTVLIPGAGTGDSPQVSFEKQNDGAAVLVSWPDGSTEKILFTNGSSKPEVISLAPNSAACGGTSSGTSGSPRG